MKSFVKFSLLLVFAFAISFTMITPAEANFVDRMKDIYDIPERVEEIQQRYEAANQALTNQITEQRELLELSRQQTEELLLNQQQLQQSNEYYREQNEQYRLQNEQYQEQTKALTESNQSLLLKMEQLEQDRKSLFQKAIITVIILLSVFLLYSLSIRIWRFAIWRRQERIRRRQRVLLP